MILIACLLFLSQASLSAQAPVTAQAHTEAIPAGVAAPVAGTLSPGGARVRVAANTLDFWWVKALPVKDGGAKPAWGDVEEGTLVGLVRLSAEFRDIRGRIIRPGLYTLRYAIQPSNGDHLGVSPFRDFLLLSPAAADTDPNPHGHDGTIELSIKAAGGSHPAAWSIDPPVASGALFSTHKTELGHDAVLVEVPVRRGTTLSGTLRFGIVLIGRIEA